MNKKKCYLVIITLILCFNFIFLTVKLHFNKQDYADSKNIIDNLHMSSMMEVEWNRTWGGFDWDLGHGVAVDSSNNIYVTGSTRSFGAGYDDMVLVKYDERGVQRWNRTWGGGNFFDYDNGYGIAVDTSNNIYVTGSTASFGAGNDDMFLVKYNSTGGQQWNCTWGGSGEELGRGVAIDSSNKIYVVGYTTSFGAGNYDMLIVKYDENGVQQWNRTWGGNDDDVGDGVTVDSSDNVYITGRTDSFGAGSADIALVKYDGNGVEQWDRTWGGTDVDHGYGVSVDSSDNVYLVGETYNFGAGLIDVILVKYNGSGVEEWYRTWGGSNVDQGCGVIVNSSGDIYLAGYTYSFGAGSADMLLVKYNENGVQQWNLTWGGAGIDYGRGLALDSLGNIFLVGETSSFGVGTYDLGLVKYMTYAGIPKITIYSPSENQFFGSIAPNFDISIIEPNLDTKWYTLDEGGTNITFSGLSGTIDQTEWDKKGNGMVIIKYYANNTLGNEGFAEVSIFKDIDDPEININDPVQNQVFEDNSPTYDISVVEANLDTMWYTLDGGVTNYTITQFTGTINQNAWNAAPYGYITIRFCAKDLAGNIGYSEVIIEKREGLPITLIIILSSISGIIIIGVIIAIYLKKRHK